MIESLKNKIYDKTLNKMFKNARILVFRPSNTIFILISRKKFFTAERFAQCFKCEMKYFFRPFIMEIV